jgi:Glycosyl transferase family 2
VPEPLVSVVVVNYNYARFLRESIDSVLGQDYATIEVIVVDDGSTDGSVEIIRSYGDRIRPVLKGNGGHGSCVNAGFRASLGDLVMFLDADDRYLPGAIREVAEAARDGAVLIQFRLNIVDGQGRFIAEYPWPRVRLDSGDVRPILTSRGTFTCMVSSANAFRRDVLAKLLPLDEKEFVRAPDGFLVHTVPFYGSVAAIEKPLGCYRMHGGNDSTTYVRHSGVDVERIRGLLGFSTRELRLVRTHALAQGLPVPDRLPMRHMGHVQLRLVSCKLDPEAHPFAGDSSWRLGLAGSLAALRNDGLPPARRLLMAGWFAAVGLLPRRAAQPLIALLMVPGWQQRIRSAMSWRRRPSASG